MGRVHWTGRLLEKMSEGLDIRLGEEAAYGGMLAYIDLPQHAIAHSPLGPLGHPRAIHCLSLISCHYLLVAIGKWQPAMLAGRSNQSTLMRQRCSCKLRIRQCTKASALDIT